MIDKIREILNMNIEPEKALEMLYDFHDSDIAELLEELDIEERMKLYNILKLDNEKLSNIITYLDDKQEILHELGLQKTVEIIEELDSDDASEILDELEEDEKQKVLDLVEDEVKDDIELIDSYDDDEVGSLISNNFIFCHKDDDVPTAMNSLVSQAKENDNVGIIFVLDENDKYYGLIELKNLFIARRNTLLTDIIEVNYPKFYAEEKIREIYPSLTDYDLPIYPVIDENEELIGVIDHEEIINLIKDQMEEDILMFASLPEESGNFFKNAVKRLPWLIGLLVLGILISMVISRFENVVAALPVVIFFQSLILGMGGNVGTQSLAIMIRVLNDEKASKADLAKTVLKETFVGFLNGILLAIISTVLIGFFIYLVKLEVAVGKETTLGLSFLTSGVIGLSLIGAMTTSSFIGATIPLILKKLRVDPSVASGPFITTINDIVAVLLYYGLALLLIINLVL